MATVCPLCVDPNSNEVVAQILMKRATNASIAKQYNMTSAMVTAHIKDHVQMALRPALRRIMLNPETTTALATARSHAAFILVDKTAAISATLDKLMAAADDMDPVGLDDDGARNWNRIQDAIDKKTQLLLGYLREVGVWSGDIQENTTTINIQAEHAEFRTLILNTLKKYPDVLSKVQETLSNGMEDDDDI